MGRSRSKRGRGKPPLGALLGPDGVEDVVAALRHLSRTAAVELALEIGSVIVNKVFGGDIAALRSQGRKNRSLRKLAAHPRLPFSAVTLWRSIAIYELAERMPGFVRAKNLGVGHLRAVLGLPPDLQEKLLRLAETERWTKERLEQVVAARRPKGGKRRGRPPLPPALKSLRHLEQLTAHDGLSRELEVLDRLDENEAKQAREALRAFREWCDLVEESLARRFKPIVADTEN